VATVKRPEPVPGGMVAMISVEVTEEAGAKFVLSRTRVGSTSLNSVPLMVTVEPAAPMVGVKPFSVGASGSPTMNAVRLCVVVPATVTLIAPSVAPAGTAATSCVAVACVTVASLLSQK